MSGLGVPDRAHLAHRARPDRDASIASAVSGRAHGSAGVGETESPVPGRPVVLEPGVHVEQDGLAIPVQLLCLPE